MYPEVQREEHQMSFYFSVPEEGMPQPRCPSCNEEIHAVHSRLIEGEEVMVSPEKTGIRLHKMLHTCPHCYSVLGMTSY